MAEKKRNFLLARGESLTVAIPAPGRVLEREAPYSFAEAQARLAPMLTAAVASFDSLPEAACPSDYAVASLVLNPEYIAKSYYPEALLRAFDLRAVGSHSTRITPEKRSKGRVPVEKLTTELYVAGSRRRFRDMMETIPLLNDPAVAEALPAVEQLTKKPARNKIKPISATSDEVALEVVLHASEATNNGFILEGFQAYVRDLGLKVDMDRRLHAGSLCFLSLKAPQDMLEDLAEFSFLRVVRQMPQLRLLEPVLRGATPSAGKAKLPAEKAHDLQVRVAVFDGGLPPDSPISTWTTLHEPAGIGKPRASYVEHGLQVTAAVLFGHLDPGGVAPRPYAHVDHYRVLDEDSGNDAELHDVLRRIRDVLDTTPTYDFVNISLGPSLSIEDDDVHAWTAMLDERLADGLTVATVAAGNNGEADADSGLNRVQVPGDSVNSMSIGACDGTDARWARASYSAIGPGRSPGLVKPDLVAFGGSLRQPFLTLTTDARIIGVCGTSFAAPYALRAGTGVRAHFGSTLGALAIQALLVHSTQAGEHPQHEVGWGKLPDEIDDLVECRPGVIRVVYQGELTASKYLRAPVPLPSGKIKGKVSITATCCYATEVDTAHASNYTRSGLEIAFRPHAEKFKEDAVQPTTRPYFSKAGMFATEDELRQDAHKWETCLHHRERMLATSLNKPVFDIHYMSRDEGRTDTKTRKIKYALVVTVVAKHHPDFYDRVVRDYRGYLEPLVPVIEVPIRANIRGAK